MSLHWKQISLLMLLLAALALVIPGTACAGADAVVFGPVGTTDFNVRDHAVAVDDDGFVYLAGSASSRMTATKGAYDSSFNGGKSDIFIAKIDGRTMMPIAVTFLGGDGDESVRAMLIDKDNTLVLTGSTSSSDFASIPDRPFPKEEAVFVARLDNTLERLIGANFLGPGRGLGLAVSSGGNLYLAGETRSASFPSPIKGWDTTYNGGRADVFLARLASSLNILRMTLIGGSDWELAQALAVTKTGEVVLAGFTRSSDFPVSGNPFNVNSEDPGGNGFVARFSPELDTMKASVLLGGSGHDVINSLVLGTDEKIYVSGFTVSSDFPTTPGVFNESYSGEADIFVSRISSNLEKLEASTLIGGPARDWAYGLVFQDGGVYIAGDADSVNFFGLPKSTTGTRKDEAGDIVLFKLDRDLKKINDVIFTGGERNERAPVIAVGPGNLKVIAGLTNSPGFPEGTLEIEGRNNNQYKLFVKHLLADPASGLPAVSP